MAVDEDKTMFHLNHYIDGHITINELQESLLDLGHTETEVLEILIDLSKSVRDEMNRRGMTGILSTLTDEQIEVAVTYLGADGPIGDSAYRTKPSTD